MSAASMEAARSPEADSAGMIARQFAAMPWRVGRDGAFQVLLVTSRRRGRWILPKGWQVKGRSPAQSAAREAFEEAGVIGLPQAEPIGSYRYLKVHDDGSSEPRDVTLFGLRVKGTLLNWPEKGQRKRSWWPIDEAAEMVAEPELADLLRSLGTNPVKKM